MSYPYAIFLGGKKNQQQHPDVNPRLRSSPPPRDVNAVSPSLATGYVYLVFELEKSVRALLQACSHDPLSPDGLSEYYFKMSSRRMRCKEVSWCRALAGSGAWL